MTWNYICLNNGTGSVKTHANIRKTTIGLWTINPPKYPGAHLKSTHSYSPHLEMDTLLDHIGINYNVIAPVPESCASPIKTKPENPLKWWEILILGLISVGLGIVIVQALKK